MKNQMISSKRQSGRQGYKNKRKDKEGERVINQELEKVVNQKQEKEMIEDKMANQNQEQESKMKTQSLIDKVRNKIKK